MKLGIYFCKCGTNISDRIDPERVKETILGSTDNVHFRTVDFLCSEEGKEFLEKDMKENGVERVVISACSPRDHEQTFMHVLEKAGLNPYLMQMVNAREQVAWVTKDGEKALEKLCRYIVAAAKRVTVHEPLQRKEIDVCADVLVIGAGPTGLKSALSIAGAGRKVVVVEKSPFIGGMPVRYEEIFPDMECGSCMLDPLLGEVLHGRHSGNIELLTLSEVIAVTGSFGNFTITVQKKPRYVDPEKCIGCMECVEKCPASCENEFNALLDMRKAISVPFPGALPNAAFIDKRFCLRGSGENCSLCRDACPVEGAVRYDETESTVERKAGAIVLAIGSALYDCRRVPNLGYGKVTGVYTSMDFERIMASNGPTGGEMQLPSGARPRHVAVIHCVGSLDRDHKEYCSEICCRYALKFNHMIAKKYPETRITHLYREFVVPGVEGPRLCGHAKNNDRTTMIRYSEIGELTCYHSMTPDNSNILKGIRYKDSAGKEGFVASDLAVLCPAVIPPADAQGLAALFDADIGEWGFFGVLHNRTDSVQATLKGLYVAGACQSPMDIQKAMTQGMAASGHILSELVPGRKLEIEPATATVDAEKCSGCRVCLSVCPYKAISFDPEESVSCVNETLCCGCGTCSAACPSGAMTARHFTVEEIFEEIEGLLS